MQSAKEMLDESFLEMRWRCLSLAADLDRLQRADGGSSLMQSDDRIKSLRLAMQLLLDEKENRAERVQHIFSDRS